MENQKDMGFYETQSPVFPGRLTDYLETSLYRRLGTERLDLWKKIIDSDNYYWKGYATPIGADINFAARQSFEDNISVEPGSYLTSINGWSSDVQGNIAGFKFQIYDKGAKTYLYSRTWPFSSTVVGSGVAAAAGLPFGQQIMDGPLVVLDPGLLTIQITNLDTVATTIQLLFAFAVPVTRASLNQQIGKERTIVER